MTPSVANSIEPNDSNRMFVDFCQTLIFIAIFMITTDEWIGSSDTNVA